METRDAYGEVLPGGLPMPSLDSVNRALAVLYPEHNYRGWRVRFTGYKVEPYNNAVAGQFLAWPLFIAGGVGDKALFLCSAVPGPLQKYRKGDIFAVTPRPGQRRLSMDDPPLVFVSAALEGAARGYLRLVEAIDALDPAEEVTEEALRAVVWGRRGD